MSRPISIPVRQLQRVTLFRAVLWDMQLERDRMEQLAAAAAMDPNAVWVDMAEPHMAEGAKLAVLTQKVGDVSHAVLGMAAEEDSRALLRRNLVELATTAAAWAEGLS